MVEVCEKCRFHLKHCVCSLAPQIATHARVVLVIHKSEFAKPTNTGRWALLCLPNSSVYIRGDQEQPLDVSSIVKAEVRETPDNPENTDHSENEFSNRERPLLLYPGVDAQILSSTSIEQNNSQKPTCLIVPDGNWGQASRTAKRLYRGIPGIQKVMFAPGQSTHYHLRKETHVNGMATLEAIARALALMEDQNIAVKMEDFFKLCVHSYREIRGVRK